MYSKHPFTMLEDEKIRNLKDKTKYNIKMIKKQMKDEIYTILKNSFDEKNCLDLSMAVVADILNIKPLSNPNPKKDVDDEEKIDKPASKRKIRRASERPIKKKRKASIASINTKKAISKAPKKRHIRKANKFK